MGCPSARPLLRLVLIRLCWQPSISPACLALPYWLPEWSFSFRLVLALYIVGPTRIFIRQSTLPAAWKFRFILQPSPMLGGPDPTGVRYWMQELWTLVGNIDNAQVTQWPVSHGLGQNFDGGAGSRYPAVFSTGYCAHQGKKTWGFGCPCIFCTKYRAHQEKTTSGKTSSKQALQGSSWTVQS